MIVGFLVVSGLAHGQPAAKPPVPNPFIMLIFDPGAGEAWTMNAMATGAVAVCHQTTGAQGAKQHECRQGTEAESSYADLEATGSGLRPQPGSKPAISNHGEFKIIMSQYGAMQFERSQIEGNAGLKKLADLMVQTNRRIGGDDFVPRF